MTWAPPCDGGGGVGDWFFVGEIRNVYAVGSSVESTSMAMTEAIHGAAKAELFVLRRLRWSGKLSSPSGHCQVVKIPTAAEVVAIEQDMSPLIFGMLPL